MSYASHARLGTEFEKFLYEPIGQDNNGIPLNVFSALARQDVDPWHEAAKLARLPEDEAVAQLVSLLGAFPHELLACPGPAIIATRLVTLLPRRRDWAHRRVIPSEDLAKVAAVVSLSIVVALMIAVLFGIWLINSLQAPEQAQAPSASAHDVISQSPPPSDKSRRVLDLWELRAKPTEV